MDRECSKFRGEILTYVAGLLPPDEAALVEQHIGQCMGCREFAENIQKEEHRVELLFSGLDDNIQDFQGRFLETLREMDESEQSSFASLRRNLMAHTLARGALTAAVIVVVAVYFIVTMTWISQINECIMSSM